jgi:hypothetical protein
MSLPKPILILLLVALLVLPFRRSRHAVATQAGLPGLLAILQPAVRRRTGESVGVLEPKNTRLRQDATRPLPSRRDSHVRASQTIERSGSGYAKSRARSRSNSVYACLPNPKTLDLAPEPAGLPVLCALISSPSLAFLDTPQPPPRRLTA